MSLLTRLLTAVLGDNVAGKSACNNYVNDDKHMIIGSGFGRTGTSSLQAGLQALGYKCYHMRESRGRATELWRILYEEKFKLQQEKQITSFKDWDLITLDIEKYGSYFEEILDKNGYTASCDWPSCMFYLELIEYYKRNGKDYKVILSIRDNAEQWFKSYSNTVGKVPDLMDTWFLRLIPGVNNQRRMVNIVFDLTFGQETRMNKTIVMNKYNEWIESVKQFVDRDKLLIYNVKQGWKPLCNFLELEIPQKYSDKPDEFIRTNDSKEMKKMMDRMEICTKIVNGIVVIGLISIIGYITMNFI